MSSRRLARIVLVAALSPLLGVTACGDDATPSDQEATPSDQEATPSALAATPSALAQRVVLISVDGFNPRALAKLGARRAPNLHRLLREGSGTLNARTLVEQTITLPNHTGMMTGRRIDRSRAGHGVSFNQDTGRTVHRAAGHRVASIYDVVHAAGGRTALYASKSKFAIFKRSWPRTLDRFVVRTDTGALVRRLRGDLVSKPVPQLTFVHLSAPDVAGHAHGFLSPRYLRAVAKVDRLLGSLLRTLTGRARLRDGTVVVLTADHGGARNQRLHSSPGVLANYRVPLMVWGDGVARGDLYALNPEFVRPGVRRPDYRGAQPIRNAMVANLATGLLGLGPVPGSRMDAGQRLDVRSE